MQFLYDKGQRIVLELSNSHIVEGDYESGTTNRIELINTIDWTNRNTFPAPLSFYKCEIISIKLLSANFSENTGSRCRINDIIALRKSDFDRLREMNENYIYLPVIDQKYLQAIDHLNKSESIGVSAFGANLVEMKPIDLLVLTTWNQVYVFDLLSYRRTKFPPDLKELLESQFIKKIGYDMMELIEFFWYLYKIALSNVFDIQLADLKLQKAQNHTAAAVRSLPKCLNFYFNFPVSLLLNVENIGHNDFKERPLKSSTKLYISLCATYLIVLYNKQERLLLKDYYDAVNTRTKLSVD